jgi:predicted metalloprotease with PDZ domain
MPDPRTHEFHVAIDVPALPARPEVVIAFPAWAPGSYMVRDFVRHVYGLAVSGADGTALVCERLDKQRWRVPSGGRAFQVRYRVFAFEASVRTSFLDTSHGYFNGTSLFFAVEGELGRPVRLSVEPPPGWKISCALPLEPAATAEGSHAPAVGELVPGAGRSRGGRRGSESSRAQTFAARHFDELVDAPCEIGTHQTFTFEVGKTSFELALYGATNADPARLVDILRKVVTTTGRIFGGFPFTRYLFLVHALPVGSGGLEHRDAVTMDVSGLQFEDEKGYHRFADLAAHEFFHVWNVKRLHDPVLGPFDYGRENYTRLLWFHEGFTDYMANVIILRAGVITEADFLRWIAEDWPKYATRPGRNVTPLDELSFEAWIKQYKPAENYVNSAVSYYEKGLWAGMTLDLLLREKTRGKKGLADLFRVLWDACATDGDDAPMTEADVRAAAATVAGEPMDEFFAKYIHGTEELPLPALLRRAGLSVREPAPWEKGGGAESDRVRAARERSWAGAVVNGASPTGGERAVVRNVVPGSPAFEAGLTFGDEIVAVGGMRVNAATYARRLADHPPGARVDVAFFRRDRLETTALVVGENPERRFLVEREPKAGSRALAVRRGFLGS